ncbi:MAG: hypothetical protein ABW032_09475 [Burkholderiaceae bacterium]
MPGSSVDRSLIQAALTTATSSAVHQSNRVVMAPASRLLTLPSNSFPPTASASGLMASSFRPIPHTYSLPFQQQRSFVGAPEHEELQDGPGYQGVVNSYSIQDHEECFQNAELMQEKILGKWYDQGLVEIGGKTTGIFSRSVPKTHSGKKTNPKPAQIAKIVNTHGPSVLTLLDMLPPEHGGDMYRYHAFVVLFAQETDDGRMMALITDGNDQQATPFMARIQEIIKSMPGLNRKNVSAGWDALMRYDGKWMAKNGLQAGQQAFTILDLGEAVERSDTNEADPKNQEHIKAGFLPRSQIEYVRNARMVKQPFWN